MFVIVGLGNPGMRYKNTYHNLGFMVVDELAKQLKVKFSKVECKSKIAKGSYAGQEFVLAKPETFMNLSGEAVHKLIKKYALDPSQDLLVVFDDADLKTGQLRLKENGSAGTHNGMRSIIGEINTTEFMRLRVGFKNQKLADKDIAILDLVLSRIEHNEKDALSGAISLAVSGIIDMLKGVDVHKIEERINRRI